MAKNSSLKLTSPKRFCLARRIKWFILTSWQSVQMPQGEAWEQVLPLQDLWLSLCYSWCPREPSTILVLLSCSDSPPSNSAKVYYTVNTFFNTVFIWIQFVGRKKDLHPNTLKEILDLTNINRNGFPITKPYILSVLMWFFYSRVPISDNISSLLAHGISWCQISCHKTNKLLAVLWIFCLVLSVWHKLD